MTYPINDKLISYYAAHLKKAIIEEADRRCHLKAGCEISNTIWQIISRIKNFLMNHGRYID